MHTHSFSFAAALEKFPYGNVADIYPEAKHGIIIIITMIYIHKYYTRLLGATQFWLLFCRWIVVHSFKNYESKSRERNKFVHRANNGQTQTKKYMHIDMLLQEPLDISKKFVDWCISIHNVNHMFIQNKITTFAICRRFGCNSYSCSYYHWYVMHILHIHNGILNGFCISEIYIQF